MRIMTKLFTAVRGGARESAEIVIDANGLRIFAQEIHECENHITQSKHQLASIIAEKMRLKREIDNLEKTINQFEQRMADHLGNEDEASALKLAQMVCDKESLLKRQRQHCEKLTQHEDQLQQTLQKMISQLDSYRSELRMAKATGKMQSAQSKLANHNNGAVSRFGDMQDSLSRIQERQQAFADNMDAMEQLDEKLSGNLGGVIDNSVDALKASAQEILDRVKMRTSTA